MFYVKINIKYLWTNLDIEEIRLPGPQNLLNKLDKII